MARHRLAHPAGLIAAVMMTLAAHADDARAQAHPSVPLSPDGSTPSRGATDEGTPALDPSARPLVDLDKAPPPPTNVVYLQYGVAFTAEVVSSAGPICDNPGVPCILGNGGGLAIRVGWRGSGPLYLGGAYEVSKQDPNKLYRLALLQQARFETRYYFSSGYATEPYALASGGLAGYGNEWGVDTWGPAAGIGAGIETQITRRTVVGLALAYRLLYLADFRDTSGADRAAGIVQMFGLDLVLEQRNPIFTGATDDPHRPSQASR